MNNFEGLDALIVRRYLLLQELASVENQILALKKCPLCQESGVSRKKRYKNFVCDRCGSKRSKQ